MYKKLFESMYNGSLVTTGPWEALVTFQQMIILADKFGVVDMTPQIISRRTGIPLEIIFKGIMALEEPDPESRSDELEGRRIDRLADNRDWGWRIVNFTYYDRLRRADERAAYQEQKYLERKSVKSRKTKTSKKVSTDSTPVNNSTLSTPHYGSGDGSSLSSLSSLSEKNKKLREQFETFYQAYPKKQKKEKAWESWRKINPSAFTFDMILQAIALWKRSPQWTEAKGKYIPMPSTWLNNAGWNDEVEALDEIRTDTKEARTARAAERVIARLEQEEHREPKIIS